ncbi:YciI family protein [Saccharophagus degradans]|uniref:YciI family protein n=1 Tax=Saccharophagus degradans TaxID=86304 RepID=A0AAW7XBX4_9GAMM|nr:YciI family protein [Saccharophagus degradans]MDO6424426.1 YciI family protein [Saccharophagus degradans]MDO6608367.1 YciI family protein [Saccharophagus degradans]
MRVMVIVKASPGSEAGEMPSEELMLAMGQFNEDLVKAGLMEAGDGLKPSREGWRVRFEGKERSLIKGPFAETNELIAGYWVWNVASMEEALDWVQKCPNPMENEVSDIEIRPFFEMDDFAEQDTGGELGKHEEELRSAIAVQKSNVTSYLFFAGRCEEALSFYQKHLGAVLSSSSRFSECPDPLPPELLEEGFDNKIMHCEFKIGDTTFFASDGCSSAEKPGGFGLSIALNTEEGVRRIFGALASEGEIVMPLGKTFFSPLFGQVKDPFGVQWMVLIAADAAVE